MGDETVTYTTEVASGEGDAAFIQWLREVRLNAICEKLAMQDGAGGLRLDREDMDDGGVRYELCTCKSDREVTLVIPAAPEPVLFVVESKAQDRHTAGVVSSDLGLRDLVLWLLGAPRLDYRGLTLPQPLGEPVPIEAPTTPPGIATGADAPGPAGGGGRPEGAPDAWLACACGAWWDATKPGAEEAGWDRDKDGNWLCPACAAAAGGGVPC